MPRAGKKAINGGRFVPANEVAGGGFQRNASKRKEVGETRGQEVFQVGDPDRPALFLWTGSCGGKKKKEEGARGRKGIESDGHHGLLQPKPGGGKEC